MNDPVLSYFLKERHIKMFSFVYINTSFSSLIKGELVLEIFLTFVRYKALFQYISISCLD